MFKKNKFRNFKPRILLARYFVWFLSFIIFLSFIALYVIAENQQLTTINIINSIWFSLVTMTTTGYGDIIPTTDFGRLIAFFFMLVGIVSASFFTAAVSSFLVGEKLSDKKQLKRLDKMKKHTLILGHKEDLHLLIQDILTYEDHLRPNDILIVSSVDKDKLKNMLSSKDIVGVSYLDGDCSEESILLKAGIKKAKKAIVVSDTSVISDVESIDAKTAVIVMMLKSLNPDLYICAEVLTFKYKKHLTDFNCDEVVHGSQYTRFLLASAVGSSGITNVVDKLLDRGDNAFLSLDPVGSNFIGKDFKTITDTYKENTGKIVIGILENMGAENLLKKEAIDEAQKTPDISTLVKKLKEVRELERNKAVMNPPDDYIIKNHSAIIAINAHK